VCVCIYCKHMYVSYMWCDLTFSCVFNIIVLWDMMECSVLESYKPLKAAKCPHLHNRKYGDRMFI